jgi:hypothetical protein
MTNRMTEGRLCADWVAYASMNGISLTTVIKEGSRQATMYDIEDFFEGCGSSYDDVKRYLNESIMENIYAEDEPSLDEAANDDRLIPKEELDRMLSGIKFDDLVQKIEAIPAEYRNIGNDEKEIEADSTVAPATTPDEDLLSNVVDQPEEIPQSTSRQRPDLPDDEDTPSWRDQPAHKQPERPAPASAPAPAARVNAPMNLEPDRRTEPTIRNEPENRPASAVDMRHNTRPAAPVNTPDRGAAYSGSRWQKPNDVIRGGANGKVSQGEYYDNLNDLKKTIRTKLSDKERALLYRMLTND